jgi:hypothetical protein
MLLSFIAEGIGHRRALKTMQERGVRGDPDKALPILESPPSLPLVSEMKCQLSRSTSKPAG